MEKRVFVTGGAGGFGRALAERYAQAGWRVCIGDIHEARGAETLAALQRDTEAIFLRCDVRQEAELVAARDRLERSWGGVDVVINNAGVAMAGAIDQVALDDWQWILDINLLGVVRSCRVFTPLFKRQRSGHFVNVASMAGLLDVPYMSSYNATKAAVVSLSETLQNELVDEGIGVTVVCPSFFETNLHEALRTPDPAFQPVMRKMLARSPLTAAQIADQTFRAVEAGAFYVLPHGEGRAAWFLKRLAPRRLYAQVLRSQVRKFAPRSG
ncbi:SDR family oxidoreductase [Vulgatibacter sp.]|uniref:SDR family oxidoreductase n=1 Tax=Vulgatibacter sp. TaxID=1971226 RepID=UPI003562B2E8